MPKKIFLTAATLVVLAAVFVLFNISKKQAQLKMGTFIEVTLNGPAWTDFDKVFKNAFSAIDKVADLADRYNNNSQLSIVNREGFKYPVKLNKELFDLIEQAVDISKDTEGTFDITVVPLVRLWGFYEKGNSFPSEDSIKEALQAVGYDNIVLNKKNRSISFKKDGVEIDLSAIAKGYAVDKAAEAIKQSGIRSAIINAGGDVYCLGKKNIFQKWDIGLRDPIHNKKIIKVIHLEEYLLCNFDFVAGARRKKIFTSDRLKDRQADRSLPQRHRRCKKLRPGRCPGYGLVHYGKRKGWPS